MGHTLEKRAEGGVNRSTAADTVFLPHYVNKPDEPWVTDC